MVDEICLFCEYWNRPWQHVENRKNLCLKQLGKDYDKFVVYTRPNHTCEDFKSII